MRIDLLTVVPEMLGPFIDCSILKRARDKGLVEIVVHNLRDYTTSRHRKVDDYPFGGEAGMVMQIQPIDACISALKKERDYDEVIFTSPDGETFDQPMANSLSLLGNIIKKFLTDKPNQYFLTGKSSPTEPRTHRQFFARFLKRNDLPKVKFHEIRHTFAVRAIEIPEFDIKSLSEILGHKNVSFTLNVYGRATL